MNEVVIYKRIEKRCAKTPEVQLALERAANKIAASATANLKNKAIHPYSEGHSFITVGKGKVDRGVILNDPGPNNGAWAINSGTKRSRGIHVLVTGLMDVNMRGW